MENKNKKRILIGVLIVLILINLAALGSFGYHKYCHSDKRKNDCRKDNIENQNPHDRIKQFMKEELELNDDQFNLYCKLKDKNLKNSDSIWFCLGRLRELNQKELIKENHDTLRLSELTDSIGLFHKKMQMEMNHHFIEVKKILNPKQKNIYNEMILNINKKQWRNHNKHDKRGDSCKPDRDNQNTE